MGTSLSRRKSFELSKREVWQAYQRVKANKGAPGTDGVSIEEFETDLQGNLYKVWNRMSSGSYFPPPVRAVPIPKPDGGVRVLYEYVSVSAVRRGARRLADRDRRAGRRSRRGAGRAHPDLPGARGSARARRASRGGPARGRPSPGSLGHHESTKARPGQAAGASARRKDWVLDLDIRAFFDSVDHDLLITAWSAG